MKAYLKNYRQSPRKVRLVANLIRGKSVPAAHSALLMLDKKSGPVLAKLLNSAVSNARSMGAPTENLFIKTITVDKGMVMRRARPFARGRSGSLRKTMSIVNLELGVRDGTSKAEIKAQKKADRKTAAPAKPKTAKKVAKKATREVVAAE